MESGQQLNIQDIEHVYSLLYYRVYKEKKRKPAFRKLGADFTVLKDYATIIKILFLISMKTFWLAD